MDLQSESPQNIGRNRSFLGIRRESGVVRRLMDQQQRQQPQQQKQLQGKNNQRDNVALGSSMNALMPDGGLSPCVIKVLGVGGGGSNAVSPILGRNELL